MKETYKQIILDFKNKQEAEDFMFHYKGTHAVKNMKAKKIGDDYCIIADVKSGCAWDYCMDAKWFNGYQRFRFKGGYRE